MGEVTWEISDPQFSSDRICLGIVESAWSGHRNFAYDLVRFVRPRLIVELGVHWGTSFFAFCQAVKDGNLSTRCIAVDTWSGDAHAGFYGGEVFEHFQKISSQYYVTVDIVPLRMTFSDAVASVEDDSVDILHIDGLHTYEAVSGDFNEWLCKVAPNGIVLFHDVAESADFGTSRFWKELRQEYPSLEFRHSYGLGVLFPKGQEWFQAMQKESIEDKIPLYEHKAGIQQAVDTRSLERQRVASKTELEAQAKGIADLKAELERAHVVRADLERQISEAQTQQAHLESKTAEKDTHIQNLETTLSTIYGSKGWRALSIWRNVKSGSAVGRILQKGRRCLRFMGSEVSRSRARLRRGAEPLRLPREVMGCLELPEDEQHVHDQTVMVAGWAVGTQRPIRNILVSINKRAWRKAHYGLPRPDVVTAHPQVEAGVRPGFTAVLPLPHRESTSVEVAVEVAVAAELDTGQIVPWLSRRVIVGLDLSLPGALARDLKVIHAWQRQDPYVRWRANNELTPALRRLMEESARAIADGPVISVVMPVYNTPHAYLDACIESVKTQIYPKWELCIADDASTDPEIRRILNQHAGADARIKVCHRETNGHIVAATNSALSMASGDFIALLDHDDLLTPDALLHVAECLVAHPGTDWVYTDEDKINDTGKHYDPQFKGAWSPEMAITHNFAHHLSVIRRSLVQRVQGMRPGTEGCQDFDLYLRVAEATSPDRIRHVPFMCYHWRCHSRSTASHGRQKSYIFDRARHVIEEALERRGLSAKVLLPAFADKHSLCLHRLEWEPDNCPGDSRKPTVTIIIPSREHPDLLEKCLNSIDRTIGELSVEVIVVDDESKSEETLSFLKSLPGRYRYSCRVLSTRRNGQGFNFSRLVNSGAQAARGEFLLLLNDDIEATEPGWLEDMCGWLRVDGVGAVGARLHYPDGTIQHAGIVVGCNGGLADHPFRGLGRDDLGYLYLPNATRNCSAVTGACLLTRRDVFLELGGFDEDHLGIEFNDVDFCLRLRERGLRVVQTPAAVLTHHEKSSRFDITHSNREHLYLAERWATHTDPFYNPNLQPSGALFSVNPQYCAHAERVRKCRVLLVGHNFNLEGAPIFQMRLARWLRERGGFEVVVCTPQGGALQECYERCGVETRVVDLDWRRITRVKSLEAQIERVAEELDISGFDVIGCNTVESFWAVEMARKRSLPVVWHIHESSTVDKYFSHCGGGLRKMVREDMTYATRVLFAARSSERLFRSADRHGRFRVIPNGMPVEEIDRFRSEHTRDHLRDAYGVSSDAIVISHVGTTCPRKGQHVFIEAAGKIIEQTNASKLVFLMVGGRIGPYLVELQERIAGLGTDCVRLVMETKDYRDYLAMADLFVCSSFEESFPLIILEAMAFGLPIVATDVFGNKEMLSNEGEGLLVRAGDSDALAAAMSRLIDDRELAARLGENARCRLERVYDNERLLAQVARQYREAALFGK